MAACLLICLMPESSHKQDDTNATLFHYRCICLQQAFRDISCNSAYLKWQLLWHIVSRTRTFSGSLRRGRKDRTNNSCSMWNAEERLSDCKERLLLLQASKRGWGPWGLVEDGGSLYPRNWDPLSARRPFSAPSNAKSSMWSSWMSRLAGGGKLQCSPMWSVNSLT